MSKFTGLFESHLKVADLSRSMDFYGGTLGLELGRLEEGRRIAFYFIGGWNRSMLGLWETPADEIRPQHIAFEVEADAIAQHAASLREKGVVTRDFDKQVTESIQVFGWMPAATVYFNDPDGHQLELIAPLPGTPDPDTPIMSWEEWIQQSNG